MTAIPTKIEGENIQKNAPMQAKSAVCISGVRVCVERDLSDARRAPLAPPKGSLKPVRVYGMAQEQYHPLWGGTILLLWWCCGVVQREGEKTCVYRHGCGDAAPRPHQHHQGHHSVPGDLYQHHVKHTPAIHTIRHQKHLMRTHEYTQVQHGKTSTLTIAKHTPHHKTTPHRTTISRIWAISNHAPMHTMLMAAPTTSYSSIPARAATVKTSKNTVFK